MNSPIFSRQTPDLGVHIGLCAQDRINPLDHPDAFERVNFVMNGGVIYQRDDVASWP